MKIGSVIQSNYNEREKYIVVHEERGKDGKLRDYGYLLVSMSTGKVIETYRFLDKIKKGVLGEGSEAIFDQKYKVFDIGDLLFEEAYAKTITKESIASNSVIANGAGSLKTPEVDNKSNDEAVINSSKLSKYAGITGCEYSIGDRVSSLQFSFEHGVVTGIKYDVKTGWLMQVDEGGWYADGWITHLGNSPEYEVTINC